MRRTLPPSPVLTIAVLALLAVLSGPVSASPGATDDLDRLLADRGLRSPIGQVGQTVRHRASELVVHAMGFLGVPYRRGGNDVETGFDCSGFVRAIYEQSVGLLLPRRAEQQAAATQRIDRSELQPGDLVFFNTLRRTFSHVGIYVGEGRFIHSPKPGAEVRVESMGVKYWASRFDGARRVSTVAGSRVPVAVSSAAVSAETSTARRTTPFFRASNSDVADAELYSR